MSFRRFTLPALAAFASCSLATSGVVTSASAFASPQPHHGHAAPAGTGIAPAAKTPDAAQPQDEIIAVVNGQIITRRDVADRGRLFALSTGLPMNDEVLSRLRPQITRQLIDEKLRMQEIQQRHINVPLEQIAASIGDIEKRNNMSPNALRDRLAQDGVSLTTLIDQIRVQLAWTGVLREQLGDRSRVSSADIHQRQASLHSEAGQPEYQISEIFVPVDDPKNAADALKFSTTIIQQLHDGAPFAIVAAQFSQSQTALDGGSLGWVQADNLDPQVVAVAKEMPIGAVSNPIRVAGGYEIITLSGRRQIGREMATMMDLRQAFIPFTTPLNPQAPSPQQQEALQKATALSKSAHSCADLEAANKSFGEKRPSNPGSVQLSRLNPQMANVLAPLATGVASHPLVSGDGIDVIMVCARTEKNLADRSTEEIADQLLNDRVELVSRQLNRDLHRKATIDMRS
ncbi:peptidylprolyl isomerase [Lichenicola cladoniae]|uniref:Parvulin-like PPIase n=1 Tax=Lichenicola cladoniae TaxID=1484109 RepID=A0A6M8HMR2_9PROT|nr:peptidylprolyl isomerase [Lichenicola cladoniae]NPD67085.1 peptidylprolyl isomerase [Acetobacteraceae bacterium]QKE89625.1 peptidylprolyl isomerase [Lichenicola cladoniae]